MNQKEKNLKIEAKQRQPKYHLSDNKIFSRFTVFVFGIFILLTFFAMLADTGSAKTRAYNVNKLTCDQKGEIHASIYTKDNSYICKKCNQSVLEHYVDKCSVKIQFESLEEYINLREKAPFFFREM